MDKLAKILLLDDDIEQETLVRFSIPSLAELDYAQNEEEALKLLHNNTYDLLLIDLNLNGTNGLKFLEQLKNKSISNDSIKIILTSSENEEDEIISHKYSIDDFIKKPIRPKVFSVQIEKHLKKRILSSIWIRGCLRIDISKMSVEGKNGDDIYREILITPKEFKLLIKLIKRPEQVFSREQLFEDIWSEEDENSLRSIDTHISTLRKKIEIFGIKLVSIRGIGYKIKID